MPIKRIYQGSVDYLEVLDSNGNADKQLEPQIDDNTLMAMYRYMVLARTWDRKCIALQRTGRMFTYAPLEGQEAIGIGARFAASPEDWLFPTYRESFLYHVRGAPLSQLNLNWMGVEEGLKLDKKIRCFPYAVPIATHLPHAVGAAYALRMRGIKSATIAFCGDGATSEGDFHDAMNFAGVWNAPCVFIISNNQWAISVPRKRQTHSETLAQKALAYGFPGIQVDGNDILAVYSAVKKAADDAREGKGPMAIECVTYRMGPHTTSDDPKKYRSDEEVARWRELDPIKRFQAYLKNRGLWNGDYEARLQQEVAGTVEKAVAEAEAFKPDPKEIFKYVFAKMPKDVEEQMKKCFEDKGAGQ